MDEQEKAGSDEILTLTEVAVFLRVHRSTVYRLIKRGGFPAFRVGSDFRVRRQSLEEWVAQQAFTASSR